MIAWVNAKNDTMDCIMGFNLSYTLYNDGWLIENVSYYQSNDWKFIPLKGISQEEADTKIKEYTKNITSSKCIEHKEDLENGNSFYTYELEEKYPYVNKKSTIKLNYNFDVKYNNGLYVETWEETFDKVDSKEDWNINGTWKYSYTSKDVPFTPNFKLNATIKVNDYDGSKVNCSYDLKINHWDKYHFKKEDTFDVKSVTLEHDFANVLKSAKGFKIDTNKNVDGSNVYAGGTLVGAHFCFDENKGVIFVNPWDKKYYDMTKN